MQYTAPLDVDLSPEVRADTYRQRRVKDAVSHAKWAARSYAKNLIRRQETNFGVDAVSDAGGAGLGHLGGERDGPAAQTHRRTSGRVE